MLITLMTTASATELRSLFQACEQEWLDIAALVRDIIVS